MKVLFICSGNKIAGISSLVKNQGLSIIQAGIDVDYFLIKGKGINSYLHAILKLKYWLKKNPVDLLHAHYGLCGWVAYLSKPNKIPLVISYMGSDILPVKKGRVVPNSLLARINRVLQNRVDHVIVKSENLKAILSRKLVVSVIPNGINLDLFKPLNKKACCESLELPYDKQVVLFLGDSKDPRKNILLLKKAIGIIGATNLVLVTPFPLKPEQVILYLNAADVLVVPSVSEGSPNVVKEAMACNCPIVATDVGDVRFILGDTPGCFISSFSPDDMAMKIKLTMDLKKRTTGRERIIKLGLDSDSIARKIISIYKDVLKVTTDPVV
jgi:glycosyltransferase involved in cell wall biosynthesis